MVLGLGFLWLWSHTRHRVPAQPLGAGAALAPALRGSTSACPSWHSWIHFLSGNPLPFHEIQFPSIESTSFSWNPRPFQVIHFPSMKSTFLPGNPHSFNGIRIPSMESHPFHGIHIPSMESSSLPGNAFPFQGIFPPSASKWAFGAPCPGHKGKAPTGS